MATCPFCGVCFVSAGKKGKRYCTRRCHDSDVDARFLSRFWSKVRKGDGCWEWTAQLTLSGYGHFKLKTGKKVRAHRVSWEISHGVIPTGLFVCHVCDNRKCVRPDHLFLGTTDDNMADMVTKGRSPRGEKHMSRTSPQAVCRGEKAGMSKLTEKDVIEIRSLYAGKKGDLKTLGERFGVTSANIRSIVSGKTWRHLPFLPIMPAA